MSYIAPHQLQEGTVYETIFTTSSSCAGRMRETDNMKIMVINYLTHPPLKREDGDEYHPTEEEMRLFAVPFSNKEINNAGKFLIKYLGDEFGSDFDDAWTKVASLRAAHAYPLRVVSSVLRRRVLAIDESVLVSSRSKRMISIISKLMRNRDMQVTTMQDIGGCRAVVKNIGQLRRVLREFENSIAPNLAEPFVAFDYLSRPKLDGYRGVHYVIKYAPRHPKHNQVRSRRIEIQLRSGLQHRWAMAVETVDLFTGQTLKLGGGSQKWRRFFTLISSLFAEREGCPRVQGTEGIDIRQEAEELWEELRVPEILMSWISLPAALPVEHGTNAIYLVQLNVDKKTTSVVPFSSENIQEAYSTYFDTELKNKDNRSVSTVLVSAGSATELRDSFPSYYGHANSFIIDVNQELRRGEKTIDDGQTEDEF